MRTQIALDTEQHARVRQKAADLGLTVAEYFRRLVDRDLADVEPQADPAVIFGLGDSGGSDVAREGRQAIGAAVAAHHHERR